MGHDEGRVCECRAEHAPAPLELERHHIWPLGEGGPDTPKNVVWVCPTTHTNTHELLRWFLREERVVPWPEVVATYDVPVSRYAYALAVVGYHRIKGTFA